MTEEVKVELLKLAQATNKTGNISELRGNYIELTALIEKK